MEPMTKDLSIIIISTNEGHYLDRCLASIFSNPHKLDFEVIIFDNASSDNTWELITEKYKRPEIVPVKNRTKLGFIENNNLGLKRAHGNYILLLNPDTILKPDTLEKMMEFMEHTPDAAVATCKIFFPTGEIQHNVRSFPTPLTYFLRILHIDKVFPNLPPIRRYLLKDFDRDRTAQVDWFITAFFFMRKKAVDFLGILDENLTQPFYCEDLEWCFRARISGWKAYYVPATDIIHDYQQDSRKRINRLTFVHFVNILKFFRKHWKSYLTGAYKK
jgi:hypothetical protein